MSLRICLDSGHGLSTAGKRTLKSLDPQETREWWLNNRITVKIINKLKDYKDVEVFRLDEPTGIKDVSLAERIIAANREHRKKPIDILISNHHNAGVNGGVGGGIVVITQTISQKASVNYKHKMYDKLIKHTGLKGNRANPTPTQNLYMTRESLMPSILIENGFMDSRTDVPIILSEKFAENNANAQVEFLVEEFKLVKKNKPPDKPVTPEKPPTIPIPPVDIVGYYRVGVIMEIEQQIGAFNTKLYADEMESKLKALGFKTYLRRE